MSFSYASTNAASSGISWVRMRLADTSSTNYRLENEEIQAYLDTFGNKYLAAASAAEQVAAYYAGRSDKSVGKLSISQGSGSDRYGVLAKSLRREAALFGSVFAGGISRDDKTAERQDTDRVAPAFTVDQFDAPTYLTDGSTA